MSAKTMNKLREMLCKELEEFAATGKITVSDLETVHKLTDTIKNIDKIEMIEEDGYSYDGDWNASGTYSNGRYDNGRNSYGDNSYGRSGRHYVRAHYSNADEREMLTNRMEEMLHNSSMSSGEKETLRRAMEVMRD